jgi:hypothetical protein
MLSKALGTILPPMVYEEIVEVSKIYSVAGKLSKEHPLITERPFRRIHHTASAISIIEVVVIQNLERYHWLTNESSFLMRCSNSLKQFSKHFVSHSKME